jgi:hypothetical protein
MNTSFDYPNPQDDAPQSTGKLRAQNYCLLFIDQLGLKKTLAALRDLADEPGTEPAAINRHAARRIQHRKMVDEFFENLRTPTELVSSLPSDLKAQAMAARAFPSLITHFSDSSVISIPLGSTYSEDELNQVVGVHALIRASGAFLIGSLVAGEPIRGGIDIGNGVQVSRDEVFGPCLARAYKLESEVAKWPRIAVGDTLIEYLQHQASRPAVGHREKTRNKFAKAALGFLCRDESTGVAFVDAFSTDQFSPPEDVQVKALAEVATCCDREYTQAVSERNAILVERYLDLAVYLEERRPGVLFGTSVRAAIEERQRHSDG